MFEVWYWHCIVIVEITQNTDLFLNTSFKERRSMAVGTVLGITLNFLKIVSFSYHIEEKTFIEASHTNNTHTLGKTFVAAVTFEGLSVASLWTEYKKIQYL